MSSHYNRASRLRIVNDTNNNNNNNNYPVGNTFQVTPNQLEKLINEWYRGANKAHANRNTAFATLFFMVFKDPHLRSRIRYFLPILVKPSNFVCVSAHWLYKDPNGIIPKLDDPIPYLPDRQGLELILTENRSNSIGVCWSKNKVRVGNGFRCVFEFKMSIRGGDGMAFVIQNGPRGNQEYHPGHGGSSIGFHGIPNSLAIEFDTYEFGGDPNDNHVSIQTRGKEPNSYQHRFSIAHGIPQFDLNDGVYHSCVITYKEETMKVYLDNTECVSKVVNLKTLLTLDDDIFAHVGFTAATGYCHQTHQLKSAFIDYNL